MSAAPYHATAAFAVGGSLLLLDGAMGPIALTSSVLSMLIDIDRLLSPDQAHEHCFHSSYALAVLLALVASSIFLPVLAPFPMLALAAFLSHLALDLLRGEPLHHRDPLFRRIHPSRLERPRAAHALELLSLPACALLILA